MLALAWVVLIGVYYLVPASLLPARHTGAGAIFRPGTGIALLAAILAAQARRIVGAGLPELRAKAGCTTEPHCLAALDGWRGRSRS